MPKTIIIDHDRCTGCLICAQACSLVKTGTFNPSASRIRIVDWEESGITNPLVCQHCAEPVCLPACPEGAISKDPESGLVRIDPEACVDCSVCRRICPYAGPVYSPVEQRVVLCDHCGSEPTCVGVCPTDALQYLEYVPGDLGARLRAMAVVRSAVTKKERRR